MNKWELAFLICLTSCSNFEENHKSVPQFTDFNYFKIKESYIKLVSMYIDSNSIDEDAIIYCDIKKYDDKNIIRITAIKNFFFPDIKINVITKFKNKFICYYYENPLLEKIEISKFSFLKNLSDNRNTLIYDPPCWIFEEKNDNIKALEK